MIEPQDDFEFKLTKFNFGREAESASPPEELTTQEDIDLQVATMIAQELGVARGVLDVRFSSPDDRRMAEKTIKDNTKMGSKLLGELEEQEAHGPKIKEAIGILRDALEERNEDIPEAA